MTILGGKKLDQPFNLERFITDDEMQEKLAIKGYGCGIF
jgi:hypothetical protein